MMEISMIEVKVLGAKDKDEADQFAQQKIRDWEMTPEALDYNWAGPVSGIRHVNQIKDGVFLCRYTV